MCEIPHLIYLYNFNLSLIEEMQDEKIVAENNYTRYMIYQMIITSPPHPHLKNYSSRLW